MGQAVRGFGTTSVASTAWGTANMAIYVPIVLPVPVLVVKAWVANGATANGNVDVAAYDAAGNRLVSAGSTLQAGTGDLQEFNVTDTVLPAGLIYIALASSSTTATFLIAVTTVPKATAHGMYTQASAFALPATATFANADAITFVPLFGFALRTLVA